MLAPSFDRRQLLGMLTVGMTTSISAGITLVPSRVNAKVIDVSDNVSLQHALSSARGGEILRLAPANFGALALISTPSAPLIFKQPVTLLSAIPASPALFDRLRISGVKGLILEGLNFKYTFSQGHPQHIRLAEISDSQNLIVRGCQFFGDTASGTGSPRDGYANGYGLVAKNLKSFAIEGCSISNFMRGIVVSGGRDVSVLKNDIFGLRSDGINVNGAQGILIKNNYIHDFIRAPNLGDHADMIQFFTKPSTSPSVDISILGNVLRSGSQGATQSIFMRNEAVDKGRAGNEMFYRNVVIQDNVVINGHLHGITLGEADNVLVSRNTLLRNQVHVTSQSRSQTVQIPRLSIASRTRNLQVQSCIAVDLPMGNINRGGWVFEENLPLQDITPTKFGYYYKNLASPMTGDPLKLASYAVVEGGVADRKGLGAPLLRPGADRSRYDGATP